jgi:hypothetical protein
MDSRATSLKDLLLPKEHGSWSLAFEPVALFLLVAPTVAGAMLALAAFSGFFARRPLKLAATLPASDPRQHAARAWAAAFSLAAAAALGASAWFGGTRPLWPLLLAAPFGGLFVWLDLRRATRGAEAELAGSTAFALLPAAGALLAGWSAPAAFGLAALALGRNVPTVLTVRMYLRRSRDEDTRAFPALAAAGTALAGIALLAWLGWVPGTAMVLSALLLARTSWLVSAFHPNWPARRLGIMEAVLGVIQLLALTVAYQRP